VGELGDEKDREGPRREYALVIDAPDALVRATIDGGKAWNKRELSRTTTRLASAFESMVAN
jgi:hypothetical protein